MNFLIHSTDAPKLPGVCSIAFPGIPSDLLIDHLQTIAVSNGAACSNGAMEISHVLSEIGCDRSIAKSTIRISIGRQSTTTDIKYAVDALVSGVKELKKLL